MKKLFLLILFFVGYIFSVNAQNVFQKVYGQPGGTPTYESSTDVIQTLDGGYAVLGYRYNVPGIYVFKTDANGDTVWTKNYTCAVGALVGNSIRQTTDSGYVIAGEWYEPTGFEQILIIKTNSAGNISWSKTFGSSYYDVATNVEQTTDGGYVFAGYSTDSLQDANMTVVKLDSTGNVQWGKTYGDAEWNAARHIEQTPDGGYIIAGYSQNMTTYITYVSLMKISSTGTLTWVKKYGNVLTSYPYYVRPTNDGGYILIGFTNSFSGSRTFLIKTDNSGVIQWMKIYTAVDGWMVDQLLNGDYVFTGFAYPNAVLVKTNSVGDTLWAKSYDTPLSILNLAFSLKPTTDGGFVFCGEIDFLADTGSIYLVKTDSSGSGVCFNNIQNFTNSSANFSIYNPAFSSSTLDTSDIISLQEICSGINVLDLCPNEINEGNQGENIFSLYPNPSNGIFILNSKITNGEIFIYNTLGEKIYQSKIISSDTKINLADKPKGIYFVNVKTETKSFTQKIIIEK
jgi:hypothetical protein